MKVEEPVAPKKSDENMLFGESLSQPEQIQPSQEPKA
jgi:hypothetical protein